MRYCDATNSLWGLQGWDGTPVNSFTPFADHRRSLQKYMDETNDPLIASKAAEDMTNPWTEKTKNAGCNLL